MNKLIKQTLDEAVKNGFAKLDCKNVFKYLKRNNIKLYQYRGVDEHTIENIENNCFYLSNFSQFNDPFDSNIGISINQLYRSLITQVDFDIDGCKKSIDSKTIDAIFFNDTQKNEDEIAKVLADSIAFREFMSTRDVKDIDELTFLEFFILNPDLFHKIFNASAMNNSELYDESLMKIAIDMALDCFQNTSNEEKRDKAQRAFDILDDVDTDWLQKTSFLSNLFGKNIPQEEIDKIYNQIDEMIQGLYNSLSKEIGVSCFSTICNDILMWSHYANKHKGICIEYDFSSLEKLENINAFLLPVLYSNERPLLPVEKLHLENGQATQSSIIEIFPELIKAILTKSNVWKYENEWRFIALAKPEQSIQLPIITKIYVGANTSKEDYEKVVSAVGDRNIQIVKYSLKCDKYELE